MKNTRTNGADTMKRQGRIIEFVNQKGFEE